MHFKETLKTKLTTRVFPYGPKMAKKWAMASYKVKLYKMHRLKKSMAILKRDKFKLVKVRFLEQDEE